MLVVGAGRMSQVLAQMAQLLGHEVYVCDPRAEYASGVDVAGATLLRTMPGDTVPALAPDGHMAIVALTHDPKLDDLALREALMEALKSSAFYRRDRLAATDRGAPRLSRAGSGGGARGVGGGGGGSLRGVSAA
jgi:3-hydroxyacyl-CoA dehydrogenase